MTLPQPPGGPPGDRPLSVTELATLAKEVLEAALPPVWVVGEVSGFRKHANGHWFFTLKDAGAKLGCVMWRADAARAKGEPQEGMQLFARGTLTLYPPWGETRFMVRDLLATMEGGLHAALLERVRASLEKDGLFALERKRPLPPFPRAIGVVTSASGAVWRDIVAVTGRRWPLVELVLIGAKVQGEDAPADLRRALELANRLETLDLLIVGRGGGSKEDLWAFNDEGVARAVAASRVPVISAVGHEGDVSLTDLVADVRAATPSAAAEKAVPDRAELLHRLDVLRGSLASGAARRVALVEEQLRHAATRMARSCERMTDRGTTRLRDAHTRMGLAVARAVEARRAEVARLAGQLDALTPHRVLERGYAVARDADGRVLRRAADLPPGLRFRLRVADGEVRARSEGTP
ncbi:MAG: exodeoxyribonuclease VII large subunit [Gemmatimonadales bacterium]